jgi:indole-3-glycerol phosphate synthase
MNKLEEICATKRAEVSARKRELSLAELDALAAEQSSPRGFRAALECAQETGFGLIAEIKKASPSKGLIREDFNPPDHARAYAAGGAACLSVLTDAPYFKGHEDYLVAAGADAILIIVAALENGAMAEIEAAALERGMDVLVEVHDAAEMARAAQLRSRMIGVNNRNLKTFNTRLEITEELAPLAPEGTLLVGESGISSHADCERLARAGVRSFLVGESLMRQHDVEGATRMLLHG